MGAEGSVFVQHVEHLEAVLLADGVVVPIVGRGHLEAAGSEVGRHVVVEDDGNLASAHRNPHMKAVQGLVARVFGINRKGHVSHNGLWARGSDGQKGSRTLHDLVLHIVKGGRDVFVQHLFVRQRGFGLGIPVHHAESAVNMALGVQVGKHVVHALAAHLVHGKGCAVPVAAGAEFLELLEDDSAVLVRPFPGVFQKGLAA